MSLLPSRKDRKDPERSVHKIKIENIIIGIDTYSLICSNITGLRGAGWHPFFSVFAEHGELCIASSSSGVNKKRGTG